MRFDILTAFPEAFKSYFSSSLLKRAQAKKFIKLKVYDLRGYTTDKHKSVDDRPFGGGPGMVLKIEPIYRAVSSILRISKSQFLISKQIRRAKFPKTRIILLSAKGKLFKQKDAKRLSKYQQLIFICGHYEGVDERVKKYLADEELSIGEYVLTGGELPAMVMVDAVSRQVPGVLGKAESLQEESFSVPGYLEYPQYTRPEVFEIRNPKSPDAAARLAEVRQLADGAQVGTPTFRRGKIRKLRVPKVLLSGDHEKIAQWRTQHSGWRKRHSH